MTPLSRDLTDQEWEDQEREWALVEQGFWDEDDDE